MADTDKDVQAIRDLEDRRYAAVVKGDFDEFEALSHPDLIYTHSSGETDTLETYLTKCRSGFYVYHRIDHPIARIVIDGDVALVLGEMNAELNVNETRKQLRNSALAVWVRNADTWKLIGYQPTPRT